MWLVYIIFSLPIFWVLKMSNKFVLKVCNSLKVTSRFRSLPGPKGLPVLGNLFQLDFKNTHMACTKWSKEYGPVFKFGFLGKKIIVLTSSETIRKAFSSDGLCPHTNDRAINVSKHVFHGRKHMGCADLNPETIGLREILKRDIQLFLCGRNKFENAMNDSVGHLMQRLSNSSDVNPDRFIKTFLTDIYSILLIGETIPEEDPDHNALWDLIDTLYRLLEPSIETPLKMMPFLRYLPGKYGDCFRRTIQARDRVSKRYFDSQKETYEEGRVRGLVDVCLQIQQEETKEKGTSWLEDDYIKGLIYDTVAAGMSEMLKTLRLLILLSSHHQNYQSRVQSEIDEVIGSDMPTAEHRRNMPFTQAFILEMLRYVSQTPLAIPHKCNKDIVLDGYVIEKNSGILPNIWGIHHDEETWGDPWEFRPERFLENDTLLPSDHKLMQSLIPFSVGKRSCPGQNFAMSRTFIILTSLLQQLRFVAPKDEPLPSTDPRLYTSKYPLHLPVFKCRALPRTEVMQRM